MRHLMTLKVLSFVLKHSFYKKNKKYLTFFSCFCRLFVHVFLLGSWTVLLVKAVLTGAISLCSLFLFVTLVHSN